MIKESENSKFPKLSENLDVDVAIVGGGLVGIDTAYLLSESGLSVAVLEAKTIGSGTTSKTTAFLTQSIDTSYADMVGMFGVAKTKQVWKAHGEAINTVEKIIKKEKIDCDFMRCSNYQFARTENELKELEEENKAMKKLGFKTRMHRKNRFSFPTVGSLELPYQAKYRAGPFLKALADITASRGVQIFEHSKVTKVEDSKGPRLSVNGKTVTAKNVIIATYDPLGNPGPTKFKKGMYLSYVMALEIPKGKIPEAIYEDLNNPYHYFRIDQGPKADYMIIGGEDHRWELPIDPKKNFKGLQEYIKETFPDLKYKMTSKWTGPILEPSDGLPLIGTYEPHKFVACAFSGNGMTYSMIAAQLFCEMLADRKSAYVRIFDPKRTPSVKQLAKKTVDYGGEFMGGAVKNIFK